MPANHQKSKYHRQIAPGVFVDVYDLLRAFEVTEPELQHLVKKALAAGKRGHKDFEQDIKDILQSAQCAADNLIKIGGELHPDAGSAIDVICNTINCGCKTKDLLVELRPIEVNYPHDGHYVSNEFGEFSIEKGLLRNAHGNYHCISGAHEKITLVGYDEYRKNGGTFFKDR